MQDKKSSLFIESCLFVRSSFTVDADCALYTKDFAYMQWIET